jgi:hypothetical protein
VIVNVALILSPYLDLGFLECVFFIKNTR